MRLKKMKEKLGVTMMAPWLAGWSLNWAGRTLGMAESSAKGKAFYPIAGRLAKKV
jgi:hypothetical protein